MDGSRRVEASQRTSIGEMLAAEAHFVDTQQWDEWLNLFEETCEYWIPSWDSEHELVSDPQSEVSLMYYPNRMGLEDRVFRLRTEQSAASTPMPRTCHMLSGILINPNDDGTCSVTANWVTHLFRFGKASEFFGRYEYLLAPHQGSWRIRKKKIVVLNDIIPTVLDIYSV